MSKKQEKIFVIAIVVLIIFSFIYLQESNTLFNSILGQFSEVDWEEVKERDIVKNSIPIDLIEKINGKCMMSAQKFDLIIDHEYFIRANELELELEFDRENKTIVISCDMLEGDKSRLNVWYVIEESSTHSKKFQYFVTPWTQDIGND